jgi:hypothetical protein
LPAAERIGPHEESVVSTLVGNLLGDGYGEKRLGATRFHVHMSSKNVEYINWLHLFFNQKGYCSPDRPKLSKQIGKHNKVYFSCKFRTYSFSSLNWLYQSFYKQKNLSTKQNKSVPSDIHHLLTPRALAIWIMDDGGTSGQGVKISTESFLLEDIIVLQNTILEKYKISSTIQRHKSKHVLYFPKSQLAALSRCVKPYMIPCMYYKLNGN